MSERYSREVYLRMSERHSREVYLRVCTTVYLKVYLRVCTTVYLRVYLRREGGMLRREVYLPWERGRHVAQSVLPSPEWVGYSRFTVGR